MYKIYLIAFDPYKTDADALHKIIKSNTHLSNWWHYLGSTYLIKSEYTLATVKNDILSKWPNQQFLIVEVNLHNKGGWLPQKAWDWINKNK